MAIFRDAQNSVARGLSMAASNMLLSRKNGPIEDIPWALGENPANLFFYLYLLKFDF